MATRTHEEVKVIDGPTSPEGDVIFQVTLENGSIMTRAFGSDWRDDVRPFPNVGENGEVLIPA